MRLRDDRGYALAMALGAIVLVSVIAATSYSLSQKTLEQASTTALSNSAYQTAASALDYEAALFEGGLNPVTKTGKTLPTGESYDITYTKVSDSLIKLEATAKKGNQTEKVSVQYTVFDFSETVYSGSGNIFSGPAFNSPQSMIIGALYLKLGKKEKVSSSLSFVDGPLYVEGGELDPKGGVRWVNTANYPSYKLYADIIPSRLPGNVESAKLDQQLTPPAITPEIIDRLRAKSKTSGTYYSQSTTLGAAGDKFNPTKNGVFTSNDVIFVEGTATIPDVISSYKGSFVIFATDMIVMRGRLIPQDYATNPSNPPAGSFDAYYSPTLDKKSDELPQVRANYCASLISPGPINLAWPLSGNNSTTLFNFCGVLFSNTTINCKESVRGAIIARGAIDPNKKMIFATQKDIRTFIPEDIRDLFVSALGKSEWTRSR